MRKYQLKTENEDVDMLLLSKLTGNEEYYEDLAEVSDGVKVSVSDC